MAVSVVCGTVMLVPAYNLFLTREKADARRLMFASFLSTCLVQLAYAIDRL
ncbi:MAG: hypothetical protein IPN62_16735 [Flavobacteriales bacterium]|nr:hypothetical protein [Flavobacteriales bacterium]